MDNLIHKDTKAGIAVLRLENGPSHPLTDQMRAALEASLHEALNDADVTGIVVTAWGAGNSAGLSTGLRPADLDASMARPDIADLCNQIEQSPKPVVAVLHGLTLGAGVELALAAHARVAVAGALVAFPGVALGICPCGGATQRLPRLIGAQAAVDLLLNPQPHPVTGRGTGPLVDLLVPKADDPVAAAIMLAQRLGADLVAGGALRRSSARRDGFGDHMAYAAAISAARATVADSPNPAGTHRGLCRGGQPFVARSRSGL